jgi:hypothetical protein
MPLVRLIALAYTFFNCALFQLIAPTVSLPWSVFLAAHQDALVQAKLRANEDAFAAKLKAMTSKVRIGLR